MPEHADDKAKLALARLWQKLAPELIDLLRSGENFKVTINATAYGGGFTVETTKRINV